MECNRAAWLERRVVVGKKRGENETGRGTVGIKGASYRPPAEFIPDARESPGWCPGNCKTRAPSSSRIAAVYMCFRLVKCRRGCAGDHLARPRESEYVPYVYRDRVERKVSITDFSSRHRRTKRNLRSINARSFVPSSRGDLPLRVTRSDSCSSSFAGNASGT